MPSRPMFDTLGREALQTSKSDIGSVSGSLSDSQVSSTNGSGNIGLLPFCLLRRRGRRWRRRAGIESIAGGREVECGPLGYLRGMHSLCWL